MYNFKYSFLKKWSSSSNLKLFEESDTGLGRSWLGLFEGRVFVVARSELFFMQLIIKRLFLTDFQHLDLWS